MRIFFYFGHPAQFHFYKNIIKILKEKNYDVYIFLKTKDVLEQLVKETGWVYENILPYERGKSILSIFISLIKRDIRILNRIIHLRPDILIASDPSFSHGGFIFRIPCLNFIDDDYDVLGYYANITYPFTRTIITPETVKVGRWEYKRISYKGYMKLAYLHPNWFVPDLNKIGKLIKKNYFIIRLSGLKSHHDINNKGICIKILRNIIDILSAEGKVIISAEGKIDPEFERYKMEIPFSDMHHYLFFAKALISDSQSMSGEAAVLGTPSVRISSFKGKLSVLEELEHRYKLTFAFNPEDDTGILNKINELIHLPNLTEIYQQRRYKMIDDKIDVNAFSLWLIENYSKSVRIILRDQNYQNRFK